MATEHEEPNREAARRSAKLGGAGRPQPVRPSSGPEAGTDRTAARPLDEAEAIEQEVRRTRTSATWVGVIVAIVVLVLLLIFIVQNLRDVQVTYFGASGQLPLGVALLFAAIAGALLVAMVGVARLTQLRLNARRRRQASAQDQRKPNP